MDTRPKSEARWPADLAVIAAVVLHAALPVRLLPFPRWILPAIEIVLLISLNVKTRYREIDETRAVRALSLALIILINLANLISLGLLLALLVEGGSGITGSQLIISAIQTWVVNVIVFALWYWELDRGGPGTRLDPGRRRFEFLFPQMSTPAIAPEGWAPHFVDYLYVSFTNASAFSPTDTLPLTTFAKMLMLVQATASLITIALVGARAVNILK